jgi:hypothetical protein
VRTRIRVECQQRGVGHHRDHRSTFRPSVRSPASGNILILLHKCELFTRRAERPNVLRPGGGPGCGPTASTH